MRQRTTFFHGRESPVDPALLRLTDRALAGPTVEAAREDRLTLGLDELPADLARVLADGVDALHIRWAAPATDGAEPVSPLLARLSPGLHVFYTPAAGAAAEKQDTVCFFLRTAFGPSLDCRSIQTSFNYLGDDRRPHADAFQFYAPVEDLAAFAAYVEADWCASSPGGGSTCVLNAHRLDGASALDLSYDADAGTLKVTAQWPLAARPLAVEARGGAGTRTEVGVMAADAPPTLGPHEIGMSGSVAVLGQDDRPNPVMFAFPSRHRQAEAASFSAAFLQPTGLHPTLQLRVAPGPPPRSGDDGDTCRLHTYLVLPRHIFADRYQLGDALFLASKNLTALHHMTWPVDLEAPSYTTAVWGSAALLELAPPAGSGESAPASSSPWTAEIPLHLRYLLPAAGGYQDVAVPFPTVFWACTAADADADEGRQFALNPFDRTHVGYDELFAPTTEFWHVAPVPAAGRLTLPLRVPVLDADKAQWVDGGTAAVILLGFSWVLWKLAAVYLRSGLGPAVPAQSVPPQKKVQ